MAGSGGSSGIAGVKAAEVETSIVARKPGVVVNASAVAAKPRSGVAAGEQAGVNRAAAQ